MTPPSQIAHYRITTKLGEGGMGAVYRATDTKLNRDVAIKILPPAFAEDADRMARFTREAQVLASLNHPNIAAIYGIEAGAIVMELVDGSDLSGPLAIPTVLDYARQIAAGLEAAHEKGIVHRDLKPANIKLTSDGTIKLLDFGLAKATEQSSVAASAVSPTLSPTLSLAMTQAGMILGTAAYMSPEQARGKPVDRRSDIWAYGVILFELLTGTHLYGGGETVTDTLAAVVLKEPDFATLPEATPARLRRLIERCLRKDPKLRLRDIGEARIALDEPEPVALPVPAPQATRRAWLPWTAAALALLAAGAAWFRPAAPAAGPATIHFSFPFPPGTNGSASPAAAQAVPSPDGRYLVLVARDNAANKESLWLRPLDSPAFHHLEKTEGANFPFWSPDSQHIGFFAENKVKRISVSGGSVQTLCDMGAKNGGARVPGDGGTWNADGAIVFAKTASPLMRVPAVGGLPTQVTSIDKDPGGHRWPQFLPDGRHLLYLAAGQTPENSAIYVQEIGSANRILVTRNSTHAVWAPPGRLLFVREGTLFAQPLNPKTFQLEGEPLPVAEDVTFNETNGRSAFAVSPNGVLVFRSGQGNLTSQISWRDRQGKVLAQIGQPGEFANLSLSPDEKSVAMVLGKAKLDTWIMELATGALNRLTRDGRETLYSVPIWSPDSQRLVITRIESETIEINLSSGQSSHLTKDPLIAADWMPDGSSILLGERYRSRLALLPLTAGANARTILETPYRTGLYRISPDGKFIAYASYETGASEIFVAAFPSFNVKRKVSNGGGLYPVWARDGKELFYRSSDGMMTAAEIRTAPALESGPPHALFKYGTSTLGNRFSIAADGKRFLVLEPVRTSTDVPPEINVVVNWAAR